MTDHYADNFEKTTERPPAMIDGGDYGGAVRVIFDQVTTAGTEAVGDRLFIGKLPPGYRVIGGRLNTEALGAGTTLTLGDTGDADRLVTATATASAVIINLVIGFRNETADTIDLFATVGGSTLTAGRLIQLALLAVRV